MCEQDHSLNLPRWVEPRKLVVAGASFKRVISEDDLSRLKRLALAIKRVSVELEFGRDEQGKPCLSGELQAELDLECQRCLEAMPFSLHKRFHLQLVWDEAEAKALSSDREPWIVGESEEDLVAILEEEILLDLPVVPKHDFDCIDAQLLSYGEGAAVEESPTNPFSVLADLKSQQ